MSHHVKLFIIITPTFSYIPAWCKLVFNLHSSKLTIFSELPWYLLNLFLPSDTSIFSPLSTLDPLLWEGTYVTAVSTHES